MKLLYTLLFAVLFLFSMDEASAVEPNKYDQSNSTTGDNRLAPLKRTDNPRIYDSIISAAMDWQKAVLERDADKLLVFALPEYKDKVKSQLRDKYSVFYQFFFNDRHSVYSLLRDSDQLELGLIVHKPLKPSTHNPDGVTVCYYDTSKLNPVTDHDIVQLMMLSNISAAVCIYFFRDNGHWYSNFEFSADEYDE